jgi:hypothetical protein
VSNYLYVPKKCLHKPCGLWPIMLSNRISCTQDELRVAGCDPEECLIEVPTRGLEWITHPVLAWSSTTFAAGAVPSIAAAMYPDT